MLRNPRAGLFVRRDAERQCDRPRQQVVLYSVHPCLERLRGILRQDGHPLEKEHRPLVDPLVGHPVHHHPCLVNLAALIGLPGPLDSVHARKGAR